MKTINYSGISWHHDDATSSLAGHFITTTVYVVIAKSIYCVLTSTVPQRCFSSPHLRLGISSRSDLFERLQEESIPSGLSDHGEHQ